MWMVRSIPAPALPPPPVAGQAAVSPLRAALQSNAQRGLHSRPCTKLPCSHRLESKVGRDLGFVGQNLSRQNGRERRAPRERVGAMVKDVQPEGHGCVDGRDVNARGRLASAPPAPALRLCRRLCARDAGALGQPRGLRRRQRRRSRPESVACDGRAVTVGVPCAAGVCSRRLARACGGRRRHRLRAAQGA